MYEDGTSISNIISMTTDVLAFKTESIFCK